MPLVGDVRLSEAKVTAECLVGRTKGKFSAGPPGG